MSSSDSYYITILNNTFIYINRYIVPVVCILALTGNLLSALLFAKKSWRKNVCVFYFNICLIINSCYIISSMLGGILMIGFKMNMFNTSVFLCKAYYYVAFLFSTLLPTVLILASIDRLLISSQNVDTRLYSSKRLAYFSISINVFFWIVFYSHLLIKVNIQQPSSSTPLCYFALSPTYLAFVSYFTLIINTLSCLAMVILSILSFKNVRSIRAVPRQQRQQIRTMTKKDFQLLRCLFAHDVVYTIFSIGFMINMVYDTAVINKIQTPLEQAIKDFFENLTNFFHHIPFCASFFIFIGLSKAFRHELKRMIYKIVGKDLIVLRDEEKRQENVVVLPV